MAFLYTDLRYALRQLRRSPGFTATALMTLTLVIGATTAMVSMLRATLLNPTPFQSASQLVSLKDENRSGFHPNGIMTVARAADLAEFSPLGHHKLFQQLAFFYFDEPALAIGSQEPVSISAAVTSGDFFSLLGTQPLLGRTFNPADDKPGAPEVAVISYSLWQSRFAGSPRVIGTAIRLRGTPATVTRCWSDCVPCPRSNRPPSSTCCRQPQLHLGLLSSRRDAFMDARVGQQKKDAENSQYGQEPQETESENAHRGKWLAQIAPFLCG